MPLLKIYTIPDPVLKSVSSPIKDINQELCSFASSLKNTMLSHTRCTGLAAPQTGNNIRLIVINASINPKCIKNHGLLFLINPVVKSRQDNIISREGCLSVPDWTGNVLRSACISISAFDLTGKALKLDFEGFEAILVQHEIDHLDGIVFLDRVNSLKQDVFRRK